MAAVRSANQWLVNTAVGSAFVTALSVRPVSQVGNGVHSVKIATLSQTFYNYIHNIVMCVRHHICKQIKTLSVKVWELWPSVPGTYKC
jgi:hypothetical protein